MFLFSAYSWTGIFLQFHKKYENIIKIWQSSIPNSLLGMDLEQIRKSPGSLRSQGPCNPKYSQFSFAFCVLQDTNAEYTRILTKYSEFDIQFLYLTSGPLESSSVDYCKLAVT